MQFYLLRPNVKMGVKIDDANIRLYLPVPIVEIMSFVMSQCHLMAASEDDRETAIRKYFVYRLSQGCLAFFQIPVFAGNIPCIVQSYFFCKPARKIGHGLRITIGPLLAPGLP
jgi:hypothetical protein